MRLAVFMLLVMAFFGCEKAPFPRPGLKEPDYDLKYGIFGLESKQPTERPGKQPLPSP